MVIGTLIVLAAAVLLGIQSLFLTHIEPSLPKDTLWRVVTIACFLAPPISFAFLVLMKMNYSRSEGQDIILYTGMAIELGLFVINLVVAVNAKQIEGTMLGIVGLLLGGAAGVVSAGTVAFTLAADPLRGIEKAKIQHDLKVEMQLQQKVEELVGKGLSSPRVEHSAEIWAEGYITDRLGGIFARRASASPESESLQPSQTPDLFEGLTKEEIVLLQTMLHNKAPLNGGGTQPPKQ